MPPRHVIRYDSAGRPSCEICGWDSDETGDAAIAAALAHSVQLHRVAVDSEWRADQRGIRRRQYLSKCVCGWSAGWVSTRTEAAQIGEEHRSRAAVAAARARSAGNHPSSVA